MGWGSTRDSFCTCGLQGPGRLDIGRVPVPIPGPRRHQDRESENAEKGAGEMRMLERKTDVDDFDERRTDRRGVEKKKMLERKTDEKRNREGSSFWSFIFLGSGLAS